MHELRRRAGLLIPPCNLALFRILFGALMVWEIYRYWSKGWIASYFIEPAMTFPYEWFPFVKPLPGDGIYWVFGLMAFSGICLTIGLMTRLSAATLFVLYTYTFLIDKTHYNNHYYLICLLLFLMTVVGSERCWSLDRRIFSAMEDRIPRWHLDIHRFQWVLVYFYAGIAKLNVDWLAGQPVGENLLEMGGLFAHPEMTFVYAYGGLLFDLFAGFGLLWKPSRGLAMIACLGFHLTNAYQLSIGVFPWLGMAALVLFFDPDRLARATGWIAGPTLSHAAAPVGRAVGGLLVLYICVQLLVPLRHWFYPGEVAWNDRGHRFSWRMKLRSKEGRLDFFMVAPDGTRMLLDTRGLLSPRQRRKMSDRPDMIVQFVDKLPHDPSWRLEAESEVSLNGREPQPYIKPGVDLRKVTLGTLDWLVPMHAEPVPVSAEIDLLRRTLAGLLTAVVGLLTVLSFQGRSLLTGLLASALALWWPLFQSGSLWTVVGATVLTGMACRRQLRDPSVSVGWMLLFSAMLATLGLTARIAPFH